MGEIEGVCSSAWTAMGDGIEISAKANPTPPNANIRREVSIGTSSAAAPQSSNKSFGWCAF